MARQDEDFPPRKRAKSFGYTNEWKLWQGKFITITLKLNLPHLEKRFQFNIELEPINASLL